MDVYSFDAMTALDEDGFRLRVLIPLLRKLEYSQVKDWHGGSAEQGKDIVCWKNDELGHRRNLAIVAKAVTFKNNASRKDACAQVAQALNLEFVDKETGEANIVHDCWIMTNKNVPVSSIPLIRGILGPAANPRVKILDGRDVWDLVVQHFPIELSQAIQAVAERIDSSRFATQLILGEVDRPLARFSVGDKTVVIGEKHPGQFEAETLEVNAAFAFPDDEEGQAKWQELLGAIQGRNAASIPGQYIQRFDVLEDALQHAATMLGAMPGEVTQIDISPGGSSSRILASLAFLPDEGDPVSFPYLDLVEESRTDDCITFVNQHQPIPVLVTLRLVPSAKKVTWSVSLRPVDVAAPVYLDFLKFLAATDKTGEASVTLLSSGLPWGQTRYSGRDVPMAPPEEVDWVADLAAVQARTGIPIYIPFRDLLDHELETIRFLRRILRDPMVPQLWSNVNVAFQWTAEQASEMLATFTRSEQFLFRVVETRTVELFGTQIPLGSVELVLTHAKLANESDLRLQLEEMVEESAEFSISLVPGSSNVAEARHLDWGALTKEEEQANSNVEAVNGKGDG